VAVPGVARHLAGDLEDDELVRPGGEAAEPAEVVEAPEDVHERIVGRLLGEILELGAGDRPQLGAAARELVEGHANQHLVEPSHSLIVTGVALPQLSHPSV
jgi:hypothetical protein